MAGRERFFAAHNPVDGFCAAHSNRISMSSGESKPSNDETREDDSFSDDDFRSNDPSSFPESLLSNLAVFGDSGTSLAFSFVLLIASMTVAVTMQHPTTTALYSNNNDNAASTSAPFSTYASLGPIPKLDPMHIYNFDAVHHASMVQEDPVATVVSRRMRDDLARDGVICIRGLFSSSNNDDNDDKESLLSRLDVETAALVEEQRTKDQGRQRRGTQFYTVTQSALFRTFTSTGSSTNKSETVTTPIVPKKSSTTSRPSALMEVGLWSNVPLIAAALLQESASPSPDNHNDTTTTPVRLIRDIFLAKDDDRYVCGWHVDDMGFWPATPDSPGINAWIALDDMEVTDDTGGFALALQSHTAPWRHAAYASTGASTNFPSDGYHNASHMFAHRTGQGTCNLKQVAPHLDRRMEETARIYPVKKGDVIFHTRWLFHRTVAMQPQRPEQLENRGVYRRYSIRYGPGSGTIVPPGFGTEPSVLWDSRNGGRTANEVSERDGPWYPQAWPPMEGQTRIDFWKQLTKLVTEKLPVALKKAEKHRQEMKPFLRRMAKEQHRLSTFGQ